MDNLICANFRQLLLIAFPLTVEADIREDPSPVFKLAGEKRSKSQSSIYYSFSKGNKKNIETGSFYMKSIFLVGGLILGTLVLLKCQKSIKRHDFGFPTDYDVEGKEDQLQAFNEKTCASAGASTADSASKVPDVESCVSNEFQYSDEPILPEYDCLWKEVAYNFTGKTEEVKTMEGNLAKSVDRFLKEIGRNKWRTQPVCFLRRKEVPTITWKRINTFRIDKHLERFPKTFFVWHSCRKVKDQGGKRMR
eukprot:GHVP01033639.1.p1 GENE.GHVP01033639.1~~GHVP01033639.1.p1  ORF type:complete len:265 (+),score=41.92 GHVP01033639.1:48-797(+)